MLQLPGQIAVGEEVNIVHIEALNLGLVSNRNHRVKLLLQLATSTAGKVDAFLQGLYNEISNEVGEKRAEFTLALAASSGEKGTSCESGTWNLRCSYKLDV